MRRRLVQRGNWHFGLADHEEVVVWFLDALGSDVAALGVFFLVLVYMGGRWSGLVGCV